MATEKILFTACPQGVAGGQRKLRVHLAPQLSGGTVLSQFPALVSWPETAKKLALKITAGGASVTVKPALDPRALELWKALFPPSTPVVPFVVESLSKRFLLSYPATIVGTAILAGHTGLAQNADKGLPQTADLEKLLTPLVPPSTPGRGGFDPNRAVEATKQKYGRGAVGIPPGSNAAEIVREGVFLARTFHGVRNAKPSKPSGKETLDDLDFHGIVSQLGEYPELLEKLGLIFEVSLPAGAASEVFVEPVWDAGAPAVVAVSPRTQVSPAFYPEGDGRIQDGFLALTPKNGFAVSNFDIDGAIHQLVSLSESLQNARLRPSIDTPKQAGLAPLRSAGLSLLEMNRAVRLSQRFFGIDAMKSSATPPTLSADSLNRGWRVDVREALGAGKTGPWHSLCQRVGEYGFPKAPGVAPLKAVLDEGTVRSVVTEQPGHPELYLHEALFTWDGWSLCAPRPTKPVPDDGEAPTPAPMLPLKATFEAAPGTLPVLRFGKAYQFRLRAVDLSGGGRGPDDKGGDASASLPVPYGRYEPVPPPVVILQKAPGAGESTERLVIRSVGPGQPVGPPSVRHLAPPRVSVDMALAHGVLDDKATGRPDATKLPTIHARDGEFPQVELTDIFAEEDPKLSEQEKKKRRYKAILVESDAATIPYLPDPLCTGAAFHLGGSTTLPLAGGAWPESWKTVRLRLVGGASPGSKVVGDELVVTLPPGERLPVFISSAVSEEALKKLGLWQWIELAKATGQLPAAKYDALKQLALAGRHWMLTPFRTVMLIHAVWQPLEAPAIVSLGVQGTLSLPTYRMGGVVTCHAKTTGQLDLEATWDDVVDAGNQPARTVTGTGRTHLFTMPLRFDGDFVPGSGPSNPIKGTDGKSIASFDAAKKQVNFTEAVLGQNGSEPLATFPDTRYRRVRCTAVASTRFREYFLPKDIQGKPGTQTSAEALVDVPATTQPAPPQVAFIVPTFGWDRKATTSVRRCGLRVYLERPWFSSGDGELLAVVCASGVPGPALEPHVTQVGSDPLFLGAAPTRFPAPNQFTNRLPFTESDTEKAPGARIAPKDFITTNLPLYGVVTAEKAQVAAFSVQPDPALGLWFADIELDTKDAYLPFIRFSLARYQPRAVKGAHLSAAITTEFAQLLPERFLSVNKAGGSALVSVSGPAPASNLFEASIERLAPDAGDLEWQTTGSVVTLALNAAAIPARTGVVPLPDAAGGKLRLAIREWEVYTGGRRLVYAENWPV